MKYVEVVADAGSAATLAALAQKVKAVDFRLGIVGDDGMQVTRLVVDEDYLQSTLDTLQNVLGAQPTARILVLDVEASLPKTEEEKHDEESATTVREMLYEDVERNARLDNNYVVLVILSTVVAAIGLIEDNVAVVIGAMVIAPLLGPNLALSLGTALGEFVLIRKAVKTLAAGVLLAVFLSVVIGLLYPDKLVSDELLKRTLREVDSSIGVGIRAAAALSLRWGFECTGRRSGRPAPAATLGLMLGRELWFGGRSQSIGCERCQRQQQILHSSSRDTTAHVHRQGASQPWYAVLSSDGCLVGDSGLRHSCL